MKQTKKIPQNIKPNFALLIIAIAFVLSGCVTTSKLTVKDQVIISTKEQKMALIRNGAITKTFPVSTSKFGLGDKQNSYATPLGRLQVKEKIGKNAKLGTVFKHRKPTGEVIPINAPGRDPIVTRIMWLEGLEKENKNAFNRCIYIHGTPEEKRIGQPVSFGCIRMRSRDIIDLFDEIKISEQVFVTPYSLNKQINKFNEGYNKHIRQT